MIIYLCNTRIDSLTLQHQTEIKGLDTLAGMDQSESRRGRLSQRCKADLRRTELSKIPAYSVFYDEDGFYAMTPTGWDYKKMRDVDLWNTMYGAPGNKPDNTLTELAPVHVWQRGQFLPLSGNSVIHNIAPLITVQRFPNKKILTALGLENPFPTDIHDSDPFKRAMAKIKPSVFQGDIVGVVLGREFSAIFEQLRFVEGVGVELVRSTRSPTFCIVRC